MHRAIIAAAILSISAGCGEGAKVTGCGPNPSGAPLSDGRVILTQGDVHYVCSFDQGKFECGPPRTSPDIDSTLKDIEGKIREAIGQGG